MSLPGLPRAARILLYVSSSGATWGLFRRGRVESLQDLPPGEEGWEAFNTLLMAHPGLPVRIAVDTVDEIYRQDVLPRALGQDRLEMTSRRLRQLIHHTPYQTAMRQGPVARGEKRDRYLMMGLASPELIRPWLDIIHIRDSHLEGLWLLPALALPLIRRFGLEKSRMLLVSEQSGGLRLTYLEQGELRFSRLAPVDSSQFDNPLEGYAGEIERTRQALVGQRLLARSDILRTVLLDPINSLAGLPGFLPPSAGFECELIQRSQLLDRLDVAPGLLTQSPDALCLYLLPLAPANGNLITREQREIAQVQTRKRKLRMLAGLWLAGSLLACLLLLLDAWRLEGRADTLRRDTEGLRIREADVLAPAGGQEAIHQRLDAMDAWTQVAALDRKPTPAFQAVLDALAATGETQARRLTWTAHPESPRPGLSLEGEIQPFQGDYQRAHALVRSLANDVARRLGPGMKVTVTAWPLAATAAPGELSGEFGHSNLHAVFRMEAEPLP
ncbi:MAG: hypothetical protein AB1899_17965 [Pseudomonadota bacterium]